MSKGLGLWEVAILMFVLVNITEDTEGAKRHKKTPVWINPCRVHEGWRNKGRQEHVTKNPIQVSGRGNRTSPRPLRRLRLQITITHTHLAHNFLSIPDKTCNKVSKIGNMVKHNWLPTNHTQWYRRNVKCRDKKEKVLMILPKLYEDTQKYLAAFDILIKMNPSPTLTLECKLSRHEILEELAAKAKQLQCETERTLAHMKIASWPILTQHEVNSFKLAQSNDVTIGQIYEWGIITSYQEYINNWHRIIKNVVGPKGDMKCTPFVKRKKNRLNNRNNNKKKYNIT
ncbi:uncharacterized protein [Rhodnius prolixus]|uniref:uncharacterized protein n=1 Tax=Rhodnius prolixus TaxID=13249 RepID=UPI003D18E464